MARRVILIATLLSGSLAFSATAEDADKSLVRVIARLDSLNRVTDTPFLMDSLAATACLPSSNWIAPHAPHKDYYCHVYVHEMGRKIMDSGEGEYPTGTVIVKQKFADQRGTKTELFTIMRKMDPGFDPDHGDWEYSIIDGKGANVLSRGRTDSCIHCHEQYKETDYVTRLYIKATNRQKN